jgi:hypothetical protein
MTTITVTTRFPDSADVYNVRDLAKLGYIELVCHGISYKPVEIVRINNLYKCFFEIDTDPDLTTPTLSIAVSDGIRVGERLS